MKRHYSSHSTYNKYYLTVLLVTLAGLADSLYELYTHYQNYTNPVYSSFCAISKAINCDTVAQSAWSVMFGLPVALWGIFGYLIFLLILIPLRKPKKDTQALWSLLLLIGTLYSIIAVFLGYISESKIHAYCILCLISYAINFSLFYLCWMARRRFNSSSLYTDVIESIKQIFKKKYFRITFAAVLIILMAFVRFLPHYWEFPLPEYNVNIHQGLTKGGNPWIGAEHPQLTIQEFSDYMCFQCRKMHNILHRLVQIYPNKIRIVHWNFPMDRLYNPLVSEKFHSGSGKMAIIAIYAANKGQFWKVNDLLFKIASRKKDFNTRTVAKFMGIHPRTLAAAINSKYLRLLLKHDIAVGIKDGITGTPSFIINGKVYLGTIPRKVLDRLTERKQ